MFFLQIDVILPDRILSIKGRKLLKIEIRTLTFGVLNALMLSWRQKIELGAILYCCLFVVTIKCLSEVFYLLPDFSCTVFNQFFVVFFVTFSLVSSTNISKENTPPPPKKNPTTELV